MHDPGFAQIENTVSQTKGLFTPSASVARVDAWKEYIDFNCNIHTKRHHRHQHWHQKSNGFYM